MSGREDDSGSWSREEYLALLRKEQTRQLDELKAKNPTQHRWVSEEQRTGRGNYKTILPFFGVWLLFIVLALLWL